MRVSILIMAFLPPFRAFTSASSARVAASLHWASRSFLSFSRFIASSCSQRSSSARRAASTIARAALSSDNLASLVISSRSLFSWPSSPSSFLLEAVMDWLTLVMSARVSLVSASSCSAARRWRSAVSRRARASSRPLATAAALRSAVTLASAAADLQADSSSTFIWASRTCRAYFLMVVWVSALPAMACSRARPRSAASPSSFFFILVKKAQSKALDSMQVALETETKSKAEALRMKKKLEGDAADLGLALEHAIAGNTETQTTIKKYALQVRDAQMMVDEESACKSAAADAKVTGDRRAAAMQNGLEEARALLETADRQRRAAEQELADTNETLADLTNVNQSITASKRKLEGA